MAKKEVEANKCSISHKSGAMVSRQLILLYCFPVDKDWDKENDCYQQIMKKLVVFVGGSNVANRIVESAEFRDITNMLDGQ